MRTSVKIHPTIWALVVLNLIVVGALSFSSSKNALIWWAAISGLLYSVVALNAILHLEEKRNSEDRDHDEKIDEQVSKASEVFWKRLRKLEAEKEKFPKIETTDIAIIPDWSQYLIKETENLRGLLAKVTDHSTSYRDVPMDYDLAHALAAFAHLENDIATKEAEWAIKRTEVLGLMRHRQFCDFLEIVDGERELREIEDLIAKMEQQLTTCRHEIWDAFNRSRDKWRAGP